MEDAFEAALFSLVDDALRQSAARPGAHDRVDVLLDLRLRIHELVTVERVTRDWERAGVLPWRGRRNQGAMS